MTPKKTTERTPPDTTSGSIEQARASLDAATGEPPSAALPHLREAAEHVAEAINEALAAAILEDGDTIRAAATRAGLSENAIGPRLAASSLLGAYSVDGRVTATGVERARYDLEEGRHRRAAAPEHDAPRKPLRFTARRTT